MQAGIVAVYVIAIVLAMLGHRWPAVAVFVAALGVSGYWLDHLMTEPLAIAL